jgi:hypothetical protein
MMSNYLKISLLIGVSLGMVISLVGYLPDFFKIITAVVAYFVAGIVTVSKINDKPHLYAIPASLSAGVIICATYGLEHGSVYTVFVLFGYGIFSVQLIMAFETAFDNVKFIIEKIKSKL